MNFYLAMLTMVEFNASGSRRITLSVILIKFFGYLIRESQILRWEDLIVALIELAIFPGEEFDFDKGIPSKFGLLHSPYNYRHNNNVLFKFV